MSLLKAQVDKLLTNVSVAVKSEGLIGDMVFPAVQSAQSSGKLGKYGTDHLRLERSITGGRGQYRRVEVVSRTSDTYLIESHGLEGLVTEDDYRNVEQPFEAESDETAGLTSVIALEKEKILADAIFSTSIITQNTTLSGTSQYDDYLNSNPIVDFSTARGTVLDGCGAEANAAIVPWKVWNILRFHPAMLNALGFKDNRPGGLSKQELAIAMGVDEIMVPSAVYESAKEGQTSSLSQIWGNSILFYRKPVGGAPAKMQMSLGYQMRLTGRTRRVFKYSVNNPPNSNAIIVDDSYDFLIAYVKSAYLIKDAI
jgi:hypothetical protein